MWFKVLLFVAVLASVQSDGPRVLCYYDALYALNNGPRRVSIDDIKPALEYCTHLVYGYADFHPDNYLIYAVDKYQFRVFPELKQRYPHLKILLGFSGYNERWDEVPYKSYFSLIESVAHRTVFVNSVRPLLEQYNFDGLDLAWQFPPSKPKRISGWAGNLWHGFKNLFTGDDAQDPKANQHQDDFKNLVRDLRDALPEKFELGLTVLPHVNETLYMDEYWLNKNVDYVNLAAFDQQTPLRNPNEADYGAPIEELEGRVKGNSIEARVNFWTTRKFKVPAEKVLVGIPTFGRGWKLTRDSGTTGIPPILADGPSAPGPIRGYDGYYSWDEVCSMLPNAGNANSSGANLALTKAADPTKRRGAYAFRNPDKKGNHGIWVSYEDPETAGFKADYVKTRGLGGISIFDLGFDDFKGTCNGEKFPILRAARSRL